jgi:single-strand DNA-binding protein
MREETTFVDCEAWGRTAEVMNQYLSKGSPVFLEGRLKLDQWQDKDGQNRSKLKVVIENFQFIGGREGGAGGGGGSSGAPQRQAAGARKSSAPAHNEPHDVIDEEDIPF